jgi:endogenous inhibitor of DNA gyrase (YacG/DUF329 family)
MTNQKSTLTAKCPACGTPATQPGLQEICLRAKSYAPESPDALFEVCIIPNTLKEFHSNNIGEDPCMLCTHNQITEFPGSFVEMQQDASINSWLEIHICPSCQTQYSVNSQTSTTEITCN